MRTLYLFITMLRRRLVQRRMERLRMLATSLDATIQRLKLEAITKGMK